MVHSGRAGLGSVRPSREEFRALARERRVIPVVRTVLADAETPIGLYRKLAADRPGTFLFESAEHGESWSRWSFVGVRSPAALTVRDGEATWLGHPPVGLPSGGDPLSALRETVEELHSEPLPDMPPLTGGMVGYIGYDAVRWLERLPEHARDDLHIPELIMLLATDLAAYDHHEGTVTLIANAVNWDASPERVDAAYDDSVARLDEMSAALAQPTPPTAATFDRPAPQFRRRRTPEDYHDAIRRAVEAVHAGEAFQIVPSQRFEMATGADALDVYRVLRTSNPSPYMYLLRLDGFDTNGDQIAFDIVGSSPESLVTVRDGRATTHPIAGTRWRAEDPDEDTMLAKDLLADDKERAEHLMLVDLGRNDLGRVCKPGTVHVVDSFSIERYSHVMHIVSTVTGELDTGATAADAVAACFPAGTLTGAPKVRAMELIDELEPTRRGLYGGVVGYLDFAGDADTAIAIRTALMRDGVAYVQAGGGVVADSSPEYEDNESLNKARTVLAAVAAAETMSPPRPYGQGGEGEPAEPAGPAGPAVADTAGGGGGA
ncbi:anthranilate synthase component I [Haloechinothrix sp. YIM 98757]|uniref:Anthranilate synthase component 1 n=1 Tax=Haloechinothrix aidingensis TaxID=2752311 RepID=A0A838A9U5_9PSEU|nr:anthranilate synthase component I [Haloechinothrix aidingensis]MBA0125631.1 anthranilate synthase component I [Haloechinothrix aidingensis]